MNITFLEQVSTANTWKDELLSLEAMALPEKIRSLFSSPDIEFGFVHFQLPSETAELLSHLTSPPTRKDKRIELLTKLFESNSSLLHNVLLVVSFSYRSIVSHLHHSTLSPQFFLASLSENATNEEQLSRTYAETAVKFYQNGNWTAATETIQRAVELSPTNRNYLMLDGLFSIIRRDRFVDVNRSYDSFIQSYQIHSNEIQPTQIDDDFLEWAAITCYLHQSIDDACNFSKILFQKYPNHIIVLFDYCKFLLLSESKNRYELILKYLLDFLNKQNDIQYWFTLICLLSDPLFVQILDQVNLFLPLQQHLNLNLEKLRANFDESISLCEGIHSEIPKSFVSIQSYLNDYQEKEDSLFWLIQSRLVFEQFWQLQRALCLEYNSLQTEVAKLLSEKLVPFIQIVQELQYLKIPPNIMETALELRERSAVTFIDLKKLRNDLLEYLREYQNLIEWVFVYYNEMPNLNDSILNLKYELKRTKHLQRQNKLFWFRQVVYTAASLFLWWLVVDTWYFQKGLQGTPIFIGFFALGFTMLVEPKKWFQKAREPKELRETLQTINEQINTTKKRIQEIDSELKKAILEHSNLSTNKGDE